MDLGKFTLENVVDGDSIRVSRPPLDKISQKKTLRLLNLDTEETENAKIFGPVTEYGKEVKQLAKEWFQARSNQVDLKTDGEKNLTGFYGRPLVHVFAAEEHYQYHAIKEGWSPYYCKYGYAENYHEQLLDAEKIAREQKKGIWSSEKQQRPTSDNRPYDLLTEWWQLRAERIKRARALKQQGKEILTLLNGENYQLAQDKAAAGEQAYIFGEISSIKSSSQGLFAIKVREDQKFLVYVAKEAEERQRIIDFIHENYISVVELGRGLVKPNFILLHGKLSLFTRRESTVPEIIISNQNQICDLDQLEV